ETAMTETAVGLDSVGTPRSRPAIAVLPLENLSRDPEQEYFVAGMHEALIIDLTKFATLKVIAQQSVEMLKDTKKSLPELGRALGTDLVVTGSVCRVGDRVHVTAHLVQAATQEVLWADRYDRDL